MIARTFKVICFVFFVLGIAIPLKAQEHKKIYTGLFGIGQYGYDEAFKLLKENGFDIAVGVNEKNLLDKAQSLGIKCIVSFGLTKKISEDKERWVRFLEGLKSKIIEVKDHPAVFAWYPVDEPDGQGIAPEKIRELRDAVKSVDKTKPTFTVLMYPKKWPEYIEYFDIISIDPYLVRISDESFETPDKVGKWIRRVREDLKGLGLNKPVWVVLGAFWLRPRNPFSPRSQYKRISLQEFEEMVRISIDEKVDGILVYTLAFNRYWQYRDWNLIESNQSLWKAVKKVPEAVK